ncbi:hypothetical protein [Roseobacter sinensis]|uniref:Glycerol-3-phosphate dehydrogenase n=1 Tax=Roseobacter sinensis TaxID=2931391 RepID=A0ABT3BG44_9RHOB|nr:hypothetical protein [Roseobacter sp. WL0113]MCV3272551.1 hypothetical protein [Roseobacter sp. WL0113]
MSKPAKTLDAEDVLSSVRRLVSDNKSDHGARPSQGASDRLVLSPQQRVSDKDTLKLRPADAVYVPVAEPQSSGAAGGGSKERSAFGLDELSAKIAALETEIAKTADQWEPDGDGNDDYAGTPSSGMAWPETDELDIADNQSDPETGETAAPAVVRPGEEPVLDEAALRELVAEILRAELQGPLGERITRNVRKLVHREIHRALAARDLN